MYTPNFCEGGRVCVLGKGDQTFFLTLESGNIGIGGKLQVTEFTFFSLNKESNIMGLLQIPMDN